jgi:hypothetical protein
MVCAMHKPASIASCYWQHPVCVPHVWTLVCLALQIVDTRCVLLAVSWQVTPYGLSRFAEGSPGLEVLDVLAADKGGAQSSCLTFESMFVVAANCPQLKVGVLGSTGRFRACMSWSVRKYPLGTDCHWSLLKCIAVACSHLCRRPTHSHQSGRHTDCVLSHG